MSSSAAVAALWGKICVHNKLITAAQWEECAALFTKYKGQVSIDEILLKKKFLTPKAADVIRKRVAEIIETQRAAKAAGGSAGAAQSAAGAADHHEPHAGSTAVATPAPPSAHAESKDADDAIPAPAPVAKSHPPHAHAHKPAAHAHAAPPAQSDADEIIPLSEEPPEDGANPGPTGTKHVSDMEWVQTLPEDEANDDGKPKIEHTKHPGDEEFDGPIDLVEDENTEKPAKKIVINDSMIPVSKNIRFGGLKPPTFQFGGKPGEAAPGSAPAGEKKDEKDRIPCEVAPMDMDETAVAILKQAAQLRASDCHLASGSPPFFRLHGQLKFLDMPKLTPEQARRMVLGFMNDEQQQHYLKHHDLDFSLELPEIGRMRVNALEQFRGPDIIFRLIPSTVPSLEELGLPASLGRFTEWAQGLVLVTGPAGSGKTTTAAALIHLVNVHRKDHVITVEDPVEYLHISKGCNVTQRQVPIHTKSFASALKAALREDPDVIMIGEMRDLETVSLAIRAAETGHLVIGTLQTKSAARTIDRVIDVFPTDQQSQIRTMLSESLRGVISQTLVPRADHQGRVVAVEVLHVNNAISNLIRDAKTFQINSIMQTGRKIGQKLMEDSLIELVQAGICSKEEALKCAENPKSLLTGLAKADTAATAAAGKK